MRTHKPEPHTLAGAYALDALTGADRARFERHLARCPQCAQEIRGLHEATARLAAAAAEQPPAGLTERALAAAARTRQLPPLTRDNPQSWRARRRAAAGHAGRAAAARGHTPGRAWMPRLALTLAAAAVILTGIVGLTARDAQHQLQEDQQHARVIAAVLTARDATMISAHVRTGGTATVVMSARDHALVFAAAGLRALPAARCYELWLMGPAGDKPAGMLPEPQHGMTGPVLASGLKPGDHLGLTIEPTGGTPHPTTAAILLLPL
jgi:anti-sigma-K factor RskA